MTEEFVVTLAGGGGFEVFAAALCRKLDRLTRRGSHCVILDRTFVQHRYVQAIFTPVGARIEAVGQHYLAVDDAELAPDQVAALLAAGWNEPDDIDAEDPPWPLNWWQVHPAPGHVDAAVAHLLGVLVAVHGLEAHEPVRVRIFPAERQRWRWIPDPGRPGGGVLDAA